MLTSAHARELMGEAMDARALGYWQSQALINDTPEIDCIQDHLAVLVASGVKPSDVAELWRLTRKLFESNEAESEHEMTLAGALDDVASRLYDAERNHGGTGAMGVKEIGERLRWALPIIFEPAGHSPAARAGAGAAVEDVLSRVPAGQLFTESVRKELRNTNYGRLVELHAARQRNQEEAA